MNPFKNMTILMLFLIVAFSCKKEVDNQKELENVTAPSNLTAVFDITQDNTGLVTILPSAEGATEYMVTFGDTIPDLEYFYGVDEVITHAYKEGVFKVGITASGLTGLTTWVEQELNVTFRAPENLEVTIEPNTSNPKIIDVSARADYATIMDIYFGDVEDEEPVHAMPDSVVTHTYTEPGDYIIKVEAKSGGAATTIVTDTITIDEASDPISLPIDFESFTVNYTFSDFGGAISTVIDNPDVSGINTSDRVAQSLKTAGSEIWAGSLLTLENPIDFSVNKLFKVKVWSPKSGAIVKLKVENLDNGDINDEVDASTTTTDEWEELFFNFSSIDDQDYQKVVIFFDFGNAGDDAVYYFDDIKLTTTEPGGGIAGVWKVAPEAGSIGVGGNQGDISWWSNSADDVTLRDCFFDDTYVFGTDGSFSNVLGDETWLEAWQGSDPDACGTPVAPHDGSVAATYIYDEVAGTVTLNGTGAYLGIPKVYNGGELTNPADAPESITYIMEFSGNNDVMTIDISIGTAWWRYKMVKESGVITSPIEGTWQVPPELGALMVGSTQGSDEWWSLDDPGIAERPCFFDDTYVFSGNGSFSNVLGTDTWLEDWQIGAFECGTPVAPHDGTVAATFTYDENTGTVTLNGTGAYLGVPKAHNGGILTNPDDAPASITYIVEFSENNTVMTVDIDYGAGWWRYKMVKN